MRSDFVNFLTYCHERKLRKTVYYKYLELCWKDPKDEFSNEQLALQLLEARHLYAKSRGYKNYTDYNFSFKSEKDSSKINKFIQNISIEINSVVDKNLKLISDFAKIKFNIAHIKPWDIHYIINLMAFEHFNYSPDDFKYYFESNQTIKRILDFFGYLFSIKFTERANNNEGCYTFSVTEQKSGTFLGEIELDLFSQDSKSGNCVTRYSIINRKVKGVCKDFSNPSISLNYPKEQNQEVQFFDFDNIIGIFHEMGHAIEAMFVFHYHGDEIQDRINDLDACEFLSKFTENFAYEFEIISKISCHWQTKKSLPNNMFAAALDFTRFSNSYDYMFRLKKAFFDLNVNLNSCHAVNDFSRLLMKRENIKNDVFFNPFTDHQIFANAAYCDYTNNYYTYLYSESLAYRAYSKIVPKTAMVNSNIGTNLRLKFLKNWEPGNFNEAYIKLMEGDLPSLLPKNQFKINYS